MRARCARRSTVVWGDCLRPALYRNSQQAEQRTTSSMKQNVVGFKQLLCVQKQADVYTVCTSSTMRNNDRQQIGQVKR